jgi:hypothetical protein
MPKPHSSVPGRSGRFSEKPQCGIDAETAAERRDPAVLPRLMYRRLDIPKAPVEG